MNRGSCVSPVFLENGCIIYIIITQNTSVFPEAGRKAVFQMLNPPPLSIPDTDREKIHLNIASVFMLTRMEVDKEPMDKSSGKCRRSNNAVTSSSEGYAALSARWSGERNKQNQEKSVRISGTYGDTRTRTQVCRQS